VTISIGADPEVFLRDAHDFVSAEGIIGGTKKQPLAIENGCALQEDNVTAEFNIPPATTKYQLTASISYAVGHIEKKISDKGLFLSHAASAKFNQKYLQTEQARMFGCDPDSNAWTLMVNQPPETDTDLRTCGGHVHVGNLPAKCDPITLVRVMDLYLGVPSVLIDDDVDRRRLYGSAGAFRSQPYGVEYRTLSNFWIFKTPLIEWIFENTTAAVDYATEHEIEAQSKLANLIRGCINNSDRELAKHLCAQNRISLP
jgi:hypothetical protein